MRYVVDNLIVVLLISVIFILFRLIDCESEEKKNEIRNH